MESVLRVPVVRGTRLAKAVKEEVTLAYSDEFPVDSMRNLLCNRLGVSDEADLCLTFSTDLAGKEKTDVCFDMLCLLLKKASATATAEGQTYRLHAELAPNAKSRHAAPARRATAAPQQPRQPAAEAAAAEPGAADAAGTETDSATEPHAPTKPKQTAWQTAYGRLVHQCMPQEGGLYVTVWLICMRPC